MTLKSAQIKRVYYQEDPGSRDLVVLSDYDEEVQRIRTEAFLEAANLAVEYLQGWNIDPYIAEDGIRGAILKGMKLADEPNIFDQLAERKLTGH
jgi:hypothetical protein